MKKILYPFLLSLLIVLLSSLVMVQWSHADIFDYNGEDSHLKLKTDKKNIIDYKIKDKYKCNHSNGSCVKEYSYIQYSYIGEQLTKKQSYNNYEEEYRDSNTVIFSEKKIGSNKKLAFIYPDNSFTYSGGIYYLTEYATTSIAAFDDQTKLTYLEKLKKFVFNTVLADVFRLESSASDGNQSNYNQTSWSLATNGTTSNYLDYSNTSFYDAAMQPGIIRHPSSNYSVGRGKMLFNTSSIPDDATISSASVFLTTQLYSISGGNKLFTLATSTQASSTILQSNDFSLVGNVSISSSTPANQLATGTHEWIISNLNTINLQGTSGFSIRTTNDIDKTDPAMGNGTSVLYEPRTSEYSGTSSDPYILISYTVVSEDPGSTSTCESMPSTASTTCQTPTSTDLTTFTSCTAVNEQGVNYTYYYMPFLGWIVIALALVIMLQFFYRIISKRRKI